MHTVILVAITALFSGAAGYLYGGKVFSKFKAELSAAETRIIAAVTSKL